MQDPAKFARRGFCVGRIANMGYRIPFKPVHHRIHRVGAIEQILAREVPAPQPRPRLSVARAARKRKGS